MTKKETLLLTVRDGVADIFYYNRKDDEDLTCEDVQDLMTSGEITLAEIVEAFSDEITKYFPNLK